MFLMLELTYPWLEIFALSSSIDGKVSGGIEQKAPWELLHSVPALFLSLIAEAAPVFIVRWVKALRGNPLIASFNLRADSRLPVLC